MKNLLSITALLGVFISAPAMADSGCDISLQDTAQARFESYNAQDRYVRPQKINLRLRNDSKKACTGYLMVKPEGRDNHLIGPSGERMTFRLFDGSESARILFQSDTQILNKIPFRIDAESSTNVGLLLAVDSLQSVEAGSYLANVALKVEGQDLIELDDIQLRVGAKVSPNLQANFTGIMSTAFPRNSSTGTQKRQTAVLDMGELTPSESRKLGLQIRANSPVTIQVTSDNQGALTHTYENNEIPYGMSLNGHTVDLEQATSVRGFSSAHRNGRTNPIHIRLSDFGKNLPAGTYSDVVTFRISAR